MFLLVLALSGKMVHLRNAIGCAQVVDSKNITCDVINEDIDRSAFHNKSLLMKS